MYILFLNPTMGKIVCDMDKEKFNKNLYNYSQFYSVFKNIKCLLLAAK